MVSLYMVCGKEIRIGRLLKNGIMLCSPMDHEISNSPINGLENIHGMIYQCENAGLTCVLVNKGIIKTMPTPINIGLIAHLSGSTVLGPFPNKKVLIGSVEGASRLGADAVSVHINIGAKEESEMLQDLGMISDKCDEWSMPLVAMMYPRGENIKDPHDPQTVAKSKLAVFLSELKDVRILNIDPKLAAGSGFKTIFESKDADMIICKTIDELRNSNSTNKVSGFSKKVLSNEDLEEVIMVSTLGAEFVIVDAANWKIIPLENIISKL